MRVVGRRPPLRVQRARIGSALRARLGDAADVAAVLDNVDATLTFGENVEAVERAVGCRLRDPRDPSPGDLRAIRAMAADHAERHDFDRLTANLPSLTRREAERWAALYAVYGGA